MSNKVIAVIFRGEIEDKDTVANFLEQMGKRVVFLKASKNHLYVIEGL